MLAQTTVKEVERLLAQGNLSHRQIARLAGVAEHRWERSPPANARLRGALLARLRELAPPGPLARCPGCGGLVHTPCRLCRVRKIKAEQQEASASRGSSASRALRKLLIAVHKASQKRERSLATRAQFPAVTRGGPSACK